MSDNVDFVTAVFATASMLPVADEEVNALWARKAVNNAARAIGAWGTVVTEDVVYEDLDAIEGYAQDVIAFTTGGAATASIDYSGLGFKNIPSVDAFVYDNTYGTFYPPGLQFVAPTGGGQGTVWGMDYKIIPSITRLWFVVYGYDQVQNWRINVGTVIYRLRGW